MYYYEVAPAYKKYVGKNLLTYSSKTKFVVGQIIVVNVRTEEVTAVIIREVKKPDFQSKSINQAYENLIIPIHQIKLFQWIMEYYASSVGSTITGFTPKLLKTTKTDDKVDVECTSKKTNKINLTKDQATAINSILNSKTTTNILHGDTGTGKTQVYIELAKQIIEQGKSVLILTPEISLTPQMLGQFNRYFRGALVIHSELTDAQRRIIWLKIHNAKNRPKLIIGPRSALFMPLDNLGLVVVDEFQDSSYKQDNNPRYNSAQVASKLAQITGSKLVMGSGTPPVEEYFYAKNKQANIVRMRDKPLNISVQPDVKIVDLSKKSEQSNMSLISNTLIKSIRNQLVNNRQVMLFINRRGTSRLVICQNCGWSAMCERCNIPYVYHNDISLLVCHVCSSKSPIPTACKQCGSVDILFKKPGTKGIYESIKQIFPDAKIGRYDKDNIKSEKFFINQAEIAEGKVDILIGTQLLAKGHDLPKLGLVAVVMAEDSMNIPDYKAHEKSFILLHQLAGRLGRRDYPGEYLIQTFSTNSSLIDYLDNSSDAWINFYHNEIQQRKLYNYPPFCFVLKIKIARKTDSSAMKTSNQIFQKIHKLKIEGIEILGPAPSFANLQNEMHNWQIIIKSKNRSDLIKIIDILPGSCTYNIDPDDLL